jgi:hypothetical protein
MVKVPRKIIMCLALLLMSASITHAAPSTPGFYRVQDSLQNMYVRMNAGGFVIGTVFGKNSSYIPGKTVSDGFYLKDTGDGFWQWGYAYGTTNLCGWIQGDYLTGRTANSEPSCPNPKYTGGGGAESRNHLLAHYAYQVNDCGASGDTCSGDNSTIVPVNAGNWGLYGNYFSGGLHYQYANVTINSSTTVGWRYVTKDRQAVLIRSATHGIWGFVPRAALPYCLRHAGGGTICG